jgi:hypothetical protein
MNNRSIDKILNNIREAFYEIDVEINQDFLLKLLECEMLISDPLEKKIDLKQLIELEVKRHD